MLNIFGVLSSVLKKINQFNRISKTTNPFSNKARATVGVDLSITALISAYLVKAPVMHKTKCLPWELVLSSPIRSTVVCWFKEMHYGMDVNWGGLGLSVLWWAWQQREATRCWEILASMNSAKNSFEAREIPSWPERRKVSMSWMISSYRERGRRKTFLCGDTVGNGTNICSLVRIKWICTNLNKICERADK